MQQSLDFSSLQDIDLSSYSEHFREYRKHIESRLNKPIRFLDLADHPSPKADETHVDVEFCVGNFPAVWVKREQLERSRNREALLAHEATHIELALVERHPLVRPTIEALIPQARRVQRILRMLTDLVVDDRLRASGFDRLDDVEQVVNKAVRERREGKNLVPTYAPPELREFFYALDLAELFLNPFCKSRHRTRLRRAYKREVPSATKRADEIIGIVRSTEKVLEPEGQKYALQEIAAMFDLDNTYTTISVDDIDCP